VKLGYTRPLLTIVHVKGRRRHISDRTVAFRPLDLKSYALWLKPGLPQNNQIHIVLGIRTELLLQTKKQTLWPQSASELYRRSDRRLSIKLVPFFATRGCHVLSATDPYGCILGFLGWSRYFFLPSSSSITITKLNGPQSRPTTSQKTW
jgi:hypothetical protein